MRVVMVCLGRGRGTNCNLHIEHPGPGPEWPASAAPSLSPQSPPMFGLIIVLLISTLRHNLHKMSNSIQTELNIIVNTHEPCRAELIEFQYSLS